MKVHLDPGKPVQAVLDAMPAGGELLLGPGTYYADPGSPSTPLVIDSGNYQLEINGQGEESSLFGCPIDVQSGKISFRRIGVRADTFAYGIKVYNGGSPFISRCSFREVWIGASSKAAAVSGLGPRDGLILDGAGVLLAEKTTIAFNRRHGLVADSTGVEPNTTLKFDMCSFVQNGYGSGETEGWGINLKQSLTIAEFNGGNSEGNKFLELRAEGLNNLRLRDFDFETASDADRGLSAPELAAVLGQVSFVTCNPILVDNCNFLRGAGSTTPRAVIGQSVVGCVGRNNRFPGYTNMGVVRMDESSSRCDWNNNVLLNGCWIEDYSK